MPYMKALKASNYLTLNDYFIFGRYLGYCKHVFLLNSEKNANT